MAAVFDADAVVVGGGPAGAATAARLAGKGFETILVDRAVFPRDKVCGDFVSPHAVEELALLGVRRIGARGGRPIKRAALYLDGTHLVSGSIPETSPRGVAHVVRREDLDAWILDRARDAGAKVWEGRRLTGFVARRGGVELEVAERGRRRRLRTRLLIGADGSNSTVARSVWHARPPRDHRIMAARSYFSNVCGDSTQADLYFTRDSFPGYCWLFPLRGGDANVGVGMVRETYPKEPLRLRSLLRRLCHEDPALRARLEHATGDGNVAAWPLTTYCPDLPLVADRVMLVGDAAGLINPLNGEGIQHALQSARWAAGVAAACLEADRLTRGDLEAYGRRVRTELGPVMTCASIVLQLIRYRRLNALWLLGLEAIATRSRADAAFAAVAGGALSGVVPSAASATPDFVARTVDEALRVIRRAVTPGAGRRPLFETRALDDGLLAALEEVLDDGTDVGSWSHGVLTALQAARPAPA